MVTKVDVMISGVGGFVGSSLAVHLRRNGRTVRGAARRMSKDHPNVNDLVLVDDLGAASDWSAALHQVDVVVHCAARVHIMDDPESDPLVAFREVNVDGTLALARQAVAAGVRRFIFVSSVKVNGEVTLEGKAFTANDAPCPSDAYGISKMEAEDGLRRLAAETGMEVVIIRPPLVYGPGVKANFRTMMNWVNRGIPLPLGAIDNKRSFVALDNLVDLIIACVDHPRAANETFLVSDDEDLSTTELLQRLAQAMGVPSRLLSVPPRILEIGASLLRKKEIAQRLCGSLQLDITKTKKLLDWCPPITVDEALRSTAAAFRAHQSTK